MTSSDPYFAFFPQFTPDPINDAAWRPGFTDWDLIDAMPADDRARFLPATARYDTADPAYLPRLAADLDAVAAGAGIMVYHYFFDGRHVLETFERNLRDAEDTPPFFLCWANETWSKRWVGRPQDILIHQRHVMDAEIMTRHVDYLASFFRHPRYRRIDGRPLFILYNPLIGVLGDYVARYRELFAARGLDPMIGACVSHELDTARVAFFDFVCEFQPRFFFNLARGEHAARLGSRLKTVAPGLFERLSGLRDRLKAKSDARVFAYADYLDALANGAIERRLRAVAGGLPLMRSAFFGWDNTPRYRERSTTMGYAGLGAADLAPLGALRSDGELPLLLNSWNEWSEGAALEAPLVEPPLRRAFLAQFRGDQAPSGSNTP